MKTLLKALETGIVNISAEETKHIPLKDIEEICKLNLAYKVGEKFLVTKTYVYNLVLSFIKNSGSIEVNILGVQISPAFIANVLENLIKDGLIYKRGSSYVPNLEKIISKEGIKNFLQHRITVFSVESIVHHFGLNPFGKEYGGVKEYSDAGQYCKNILNELVTEGKLEVDKSGIDLYFCRNDSWI